jgi:hypothetical protein
MPPTPQTQPSTSNVLTFVPTPGPQAASAAQPALESAPEESDRAGQHLPAGGQNSIVEGIKAGLERRNRMFLVIAIEGARKAHVEGDELCFEFAPEAKHLRDSLAKPESIKLLREVAREVAGRDLGVRISTKEKGESDANEPLSKQEAERLEKQRLREIAERDPAVQQALRAFDIIDVRRIEE